MDAGLQTRACDQGKPARQRSAVGTLPKAKEASHIAQQQIQLQALITFTVVTL